MHQKKYFFFLLLFSLQYCNSTDPPLDDTKLSLSPEDVSCTEAWLKLTGKPGSNIILTRDDKEIMRFNLVSEDTTIMNDSLLPDKSYVYQLLSSDNKVRSNKISVTTMDTTSHDFTWQTFTIGNPSGGSSYFNDVAIIDENNIWAVGKYFIKDSLQMFNAAHWNGRKWEYKRIIVEHNGEPTNSILGKVFPLSSDEIIFSSGLPYLPINNEWKLIHLWDMGILNENDGGVDKIWGTSLNNLFFAGRSGTVVHFDGNNWQKINSGTDLDVQDIWGIKDSNTGNLNILCIASNLFTSDGNKIFRINKNKAEAFSNFGIPPYYFSSIWFNNEKIAYLTGNGTYKSYDFLNEKGWVEVKPKITKYYTNCIRGNDVNDIVLCGSNGDVVHFNGFSWKDYINDPLEEFTGQLTSIDIKDDLICAVGYTTDQAVIIIGKRRGLNFISWSQNGHSLLKRYEFELNKAF